MVGRRTLTALAGLAVSLAISVAVYLWTGNLFLFLFVPFVPFLLRGRTGEREVKTCPQCGFTTTDEAVNYCPRDGTELE